ncbi:MAG: hypothetical protein NWE89_17295 [Candidatus Bathyarchaeota archaeon]|nr:hypothetical protein [Candidatus Bathyarchaeota archaeon]
MNKTKTMTVLGLLALIAVTVGGISFVLAEDAVASEDYPCEGLGPNSLINGRGFWSQLTEEQRDELLAYTLEMIEAGASHDEIRDMKAAKLEEWGIEAPQWSGPHYGEQGLGGYGGQRRGGRGSGMKGQGYNGQCPLTG